MDSTLRKLIDLTQIKETEMLKLLDETEKQRIAIAEDDIEKLIEITDQKQEIIDYIDGINEEFRQEFKLLEKKSIFEQAKQQLMGMTDRIIEVTKTIKELETENKAELNKRIKDTEVRIKQIRLGKKGFKAYFQSMPGSYYIDQKN